MAVNAFMLLFIRRFYRATIAKYFCQFVSDFPTGAKSLLKSNRRKNNSMLFQRRNHWSLFHLNALAPLPVI
jgi:hypothetical protein